MAQLWGGRFTKETDRLVYNFNASISFDQKFFREDIEGSIAHVVMLEKQGILKAEEKDAIVKGLTGIREDVENGKVSNIYTYNCYNCGIAVRSSIVTLENLKFGPCGATGIEMAAEECSTAGLKDNENQKVTITGTIDASQNLNAGNTNYFNNYDVGGATIPEIINGNVAKIHEAFGGSAGLGDIAVGHIRNDNGEFIFVALTFMNTTTFQPNTSTVTYPEYLSGGIIDIANLPTDGSVDTTHQFIRMPIYITMPGVGTVEAGSALFYNMNYGK